MRNSSEFPRKNLPKIAENGGSSCLSFAGASHRKYLGQYRYEPQNSGTAESATNRNAESDALHRCFGGDV